MSLPLLMLAVLVALGWSALALRLAIACTRPALRFLGPTEATPRDLPSVEAIVPARNEEEHIGATVAALRGQEYPNLSITVIDDQSTDATASILGRLAGEPGPGGPDPAGPGVERPEGWVGKTWAVHQGASTSSADWLWFVDADMGLHPRALASAMVAAESDGADLVSMLPGVTCRTFWQGTIALTLVQILGQLYPLDRVNDPGRPEAIAAGGFILVRRSTYQKAGGHEAVRRSIVEDIHLARSVKSTGGRLLVRLAPRLAWTHMYGDFGQIWKGLRKNAYAGMDYLPHKYAVGSLFALVMAWTPWLALILGLVWSEGLLVEAGAGGLLAQAAATAPILIFLGLPAPFAFALPLGISAYVGIATSSVWHHHRGRILWKDRAIPSSTVRDPGLPVAETD